MPAFTPKQDTAQPSGGSKKVQFCPYCGTKLDDGTHFCKNCGKIEEQVQYSPNISTQRKSESQATSQSQKATVIEEPVTERKTVFEGKIHKCPNCGEIISSFVVNCPSCGYELRGSSAVNSVQQLYWELNRTTSTEQKTLIIRNYPIPNSKEDIIEFMILASTNISGEADKEIFEAWIAKFEQAYQKAQVTLQGDSAFSQIEEIYEKTEKAIAMEKIKHTTATAGNMVTRYFKSMPNPVFAIVAVFLVIFNLICLFNGRFAGMDIIFDAIILGATYGITEKKKKKSQQEKSSYSATPESGIYEVKVPSAVVGGTSENYAVVESLFSQAGFTNVKTIPLNDLTLGVRKKVGTVDTITINGKNLSSYFRRKFDSNVPVLITYHSLRN